MLTNKPNCKIITCSQIKTMKTKIKCKSQIAFNDMQQGFSYDDIIKPKIMYHMYIMSWHGFMACIRKQNQQPYEKT